MFFLGGGKCPNLRVVNVRILGVVNVLLANDSQSAEHASREKMYYGIFFIFVHKNINENEESLIELKTDLDVRRNKLDEALSETADEKAALENSRKKQVTEIDDNTMQVYNKVISARSGIAVVPLSGNSCGGCGAALPLQMVSEIRAGDLHNCQSCGRFVYNKKN